MEHGATLSQCRRYRYDLWRIWGHGPVMNTILLNPSKADEDDNDPTVTRMVKRARQLNCGGLAMTNVFAWRATEPKQLKSEWKCNAVDVIGADNDAHILRRARSSDLVVCGWGGNGKLFGRGATVEGMLRAAGIKLHAFRVTSGIPWHPLYLPYSTQPEEWSKFV
jgi:hypothetical protein